MKQEITKAQARLYAIAAVILLAGLCSAVVIYLRAGDESQGALSYESAGGHVYPVYPEDSKMYKHDLELYGGKLNVITDDFMRWVAGLWHGRSLAFTVACITTLISVVVFFFAHTLTSESSEDNGHNPL